LKSNLAARRARSLVAGEAGTRLPVLEVGLAARRARNLVAGEAGTRFLSCSRRAAPSGLFCPMHVRPVTDEDRLPLARLYAAIAEERIYIGGEPPVDIEKRAASYKLDGFFLAEADGEIVGMLSVYPSYHGFGEVGMSVAKEWRGRGVGSALMEQAIAFARERGLHKLSLDVFAHNEAAIKLYKKHGFVEEGRRVKHYRRKSGELWDSLEMGLLL
jgi:ribosomal protein S18 acetylase RimI-like enzyme